MKLKVRSLGNDLFADFDCECANPKYKDTALEKIMKTKIRLTGYCDTYFFETVNKEPQTIACHNCGKEYSTHWKRDGVYVDAA